MRYDREVGVDNVPYFSQRVDASNFKYEGFDDVSMAFNWSSRICGLACVKMIVSHFRGETPLLADLLEKGLAIGAYKAGVGWVHSGLVNLAGSYDLPGGREGVGKNLGRIAEHHQNGSLVIASVAPAFEAGLSYIDESGQKKTVGRGGHLVVVTHSLFNQNALVGFRLHHPSSEAEYEWSNREISIEEFEKSFSEAGNIMFFGMGR